MTRFYRHRRPFSSTSKLFIGLIIAGGIFAFISMIFGIPMGGNGALLLFGYALMGVGSVGLMASILYSLFKAESKNG